MTSLTKFSLQLGCCLLVVASQCAAADDHLNDLRKKYSDQQKSLEQLKAQINANTKERKELIRQIEDVRSTLTPYAPGITDPDEANIEDMATATANFCQELQQKTRDAVNQLVPLAPNIQQPEDADITDIAVAVIDNCQKMQDDCEAKKDLLKEAAKVGKGALGENANQDDLKQRLETIAKAYGGYQLLGQTLLSNQPDYQEATSIEEEIQQQQAAKTLIDQMNAAQEIIRNQISAAGITIDNKSPKEVAEELQKQYQNVDDQIKELTEQLNAANDQYVELSTQYGDNETLLQIQRLFKRSGSHEQMIKGLKAVNKLLRKFTLDQLVDLMNAIEGKDSGQVDQIKQKINEVV